MHTGAMLPLMAYFLLFWVAESQVDAPPGVQEVDARFARDLHEKKIDNVVTLYTADAVFVNPDGSEMHGGAEIRRLYERVVKAFDSDLHLQRENVREVGGVVVEEGSFTEELGHRDMGVMEHTKGSYRFTLQRGADGMWRYSRMEWH